jgi:hypothetical protein
VKRQPNQRSKAAKPRTRTRPNRDRAIVTDKGLDLDRELGTRIDALCDEGRCGNGPRNTREEPDSGPRGFIVSAGR